MITKIFNNLTDSQKDQLMTALEEGVTQIIEYETGLFIGVNVPSDFKITEQKNQWAIGEMK